MGRRREQTMKKIRKTLTICLTASVLAVSSAVSASAAAFKDVSGHWAETTINRWVGLGYINGYPDGTFRPKEPITRTEFAVVANNAFNYQNVQAIYFPDVATTFWGYTEIQKAYAAGYMRGDANGTFRPKANVTRQEAAVMLANIKGLPVGGIAPYFSDSNSISSWARGSVNAVVSAGYMSGYPDGSFRPKSQISRAEVVTMLNNALGAGGTVSKPNVPPTQSTTDTVQNMTLSNTTLRNTIVNGDLTIPSSMSSKSITLDNVTVRGKLNVEGGGTITAKDCVVNELVMDKSSAIFHGDNGTSVAKTTFRANGTLEGSRFEDVSVANSKVNTVTIDAEVENLTLDTDADVRLYGGAEVETFDITKNADDALIEFSRGSRVRNMNVRDNVRIAGKGDIDNMAVYVSGVRSEIEPDSLSRKNGASKPDFDWEYDGKRHESSGSSSSSSSGTDKTVSKNFDGDGAKFRNVRVTDRAKLEDMRITGDLTIEEEVENETVRLVDLEIDGDVYIYGGGENSVIFEDCEIDGNIISDKDSKASKSETVALEFDSKTKVRGEILIRNHTILKEGSGSPKLKDVVVEEKNVELDVNIDIEMLELERYAEVAVSNGVTIDTLKINSKVSGKPEIDLSNTAVIKTLDARSDVKVTGNGTVNNVKEGSGAKVELGSNIKHEPDDTKPGSVTSVTLDKATTGVEIGKEIKLTATVAVPDDKTDKTVIWSSSDKTTATVSADGTVKGVAVGTATITATAKADSTKKATCQVTVAKEGELPPDTDKPVDPDASVTAPTLDPAAITMKENATQTIRVKLPENDNDLDDKQITWSVKDNKIAALNEGETKPTERLLTAKHEGTTEVTVLVEDIPSGKSVTLTCDVTVLQKSDTGIELGGVLIGRSENGPAIDNWIISSNEKNFQLAAMLQPSNAEFSVIRWSSSNTNVVVPNLTEQKDGTRTYLEAKGEGTAIITVTAVSLVEEGEPEEFQNTCTITVSDDAVNVPVTEVTLNKNQLTLKVNGKETLQATVEPSNATNKAVTWTSGNKNVATVDPRSGEVEAVAKGNTTITASADGKTATCNVTVEENTAEDIKVQNVAISPAGAQTVTMGTPLQLTAVITPEGATNKDVIWSSDAEDTATVSESGLVTAVALGEATITVTTVDGGKTATCQVTVNGNGPSDTEITLDKTSLTLEKNGNDVQKQKGELTAIVTPESAANQGVEWAIATGADVIDISPSGNSCEITPKKPGTASITVTSKADNSKTASCTVTVNGLVLNQKSITLEAGQTYQLTTTMRPDTKTVTWESDTRTEGFVVASVDQSGLVTAVKEGTANITVTTTDYAYRDTCAVTVKAAGTGGGVQSVVIEGGNHELPAEATLDLTAKVTPADTGALVTWASSAPDVAGINESTGVVTAKNAGKTNITASAGGITSAPVTITVQPNVTITSQGSTTADVNVRIPFKFDVTGFGDDWINQPGTTVKTTIKNKTGNDEVEMDWETPDPDSGLEWGEDTGDPRDVWVSSDHAGEYSLHITVKKTIGSDEYSGTAKIDFKVTGDGTGDEPEEPDSMAPASQSTTVQQQPTPPRTFSFIPQREIQSKPAAPAVTVEPEQKQEPEKEPEKVQEPVKEPAKEPEKVQEPEKEPEKVQEPEPEQKPEQKQGIALTCADSFKAGETLTLSGTVNGVSSAMRKIDWSIRDAGATGAAIRDGVMSAEQAGTVTIAATVQNSTTTEYFTITVLPGEPKNDAPETQEPEQTPTEPQEPAEGGQPNAPAEPVTPVVPVEPDGQTPVVTPPAVQVGTVTLPNGQVITNAKKYQRNVGAVIALNGLDTLPANAAADSVVWKVESFGATGAALQALDNTLVNVNAKGVILLSRTVRVTDANGNAAIATTYFEITIV